MVGMTVNRLGAHVLHLDGREGHDVHSSVANRWSGRGRHAFNRNQVRMIDGLKTKQLPETVCYVNRSVARRMTPAAARLGGRGDLNAIEAILAADGRRGRVVEEIPGRTNLISRGDYGNTEGYRVHGGCLGFFLVNIENEK